MSEIREFICSDCKGHIYTFVRDRSGLCLNCDFVRRLDLPPEQEARMRALLGCELGQKEHEWPEDVARQGAP
jgi:hypothetical protein